MSSLEDRVAALEERFNLESGLRASQDRDLASLATAQAAMSHSIQALAITSSEHNRKIDRLQFVVDGHTQQLTSAHDKLDQIVALLSGLISNGQDGSADPTTP